MTSDNAFELMEYLRREPDKDHVKLADIIGGTSTDQYDVRKTCTKTGQPIGEFSYEEIKQLAGIMPDENAVQYELYKARVNLVAAHWRNTDEQSLGKLYFNDPRGFFCYCIGVIFPRPKLETSADLDEMIKHQRLMAQMYETVKCLPQSLIEALNPLLQNCLGAVGGYHIRNNIHKSQPRTLFEVLQAFGYGFNNAEAPKGLRTIKLNERTAADNAKRGLQLSGVQAHAHQCLVELCAVLVHATHTAMRKLLSDGNGNKTIRLEYITETQISALRDKVHGMRAMRGINKERRKQSMDDLTQFERVCMEMVASAAYSSEEISALSEIELRTATVRGDMRLRNSLGVPDPSKTKPVPQAKKITTKNISALFGRKG